MQMKQLQMNKKEIGKEIEVLIRSIKLHYDNIAEEVRIPSIELELITAKIRKLHDKSIIFNHLHYMEEQQARINQLEIDSEIEDNETPEENFIINASEIPTPLVTPHIAEKVIVETTKPIVEPEVKPVETINEVVETMVEEIKPPIVVEQPKVEQPNIVEPQKKQETIIEPIAATTMNAANEMKGKDLRKIIGFSDKYFFISQLFSGNTDEFNAEINKVNFCQSLSDASEYVEKLQQQKGWVSDSEALQSLKRYINNKFS